MKLKNLLAASLALTASTLMAASSTNIEVTNSVQQASVKRLGINIGSQTYWDSGQMLNNLIMRNPGFEGETWQTIIHCGATGSSYCEGDNQWNTWPANFLKGATYEFIYGSAKGKTGTVTSVTPANSNSGHGPKFHFSDGSVRPQVGDYMIVRESFPGNPQDGWWTSTSGSATLSTEFQDLSPNSPGQQALRVTATGGSANISSYFDSTGNQQFVRMHGTYTVTFRAKGVGGNNQLTISVGRYATPHRNESFLNQTVTLGNSWNDYTFTFQANEDTTYSGTLYYTFGVQGANVLIDDATLQAPQSSWNNTPFRDSVVQTLRNLNPGVLRYMDSGINFGSSIDNMIAPAFARQRAGYSEWMQDQGDVPLGLEEFLQLCQAVGAEPWFSMPAGTSQTEVAHLMEFLGGDASTPYGSKRAALGQSTPWTSQFNKIHLELGNETWNNSFAGATMTDPAAYGSRGRDIFTAARAADGYNSSVIDLVLSGWAAVPWINQQILSSSSAYDTIDIAPYLYGTVNDSSSTTALFQPMMAEPELWDDNSAGEVYQHTQIAQAAGANLSVYEVNLGPLAGNMSQQGLNTLTPSLGSGLATVEHMLLMMRDNGIRDQNLFSLTGYTNGGPSGKTIKLWGTVIDMDGATNRVRPQHLALQLANSAIVGNELKTNLTGANPTWNQSTSQNDQVALKNAHDLQTFAYSNGTSSSIIVFNLSLNQTLPITFSGSNAPSGAVSISTLTASNIAANNETATNVSVTNNVVQNYNASSTYQLPPYSMTVFQYGQLNSRPPSNPNTNPTPSGSVGNGSHLILNQYSSLVLDNPRSSTDADTQQIEWQANGGLNQSWTFTNENGYYTIQNGASGMYLADTTGEANGALSQQPKSKDASQRWELVAQNGGYAIKNKRSGLVLDDGHFSTNEGSGIIVWYEKGSSTGHNQTWIIQ